MRVLTLNAGSSSLKFGLFDTHRSGDVRTICEGGADALGESRARFVLRWADASQGIDESSPLADHAAACARLGALFADGTLLAPDAVAHRIVHGGAAIQRHAVIDDATLRQIRAAIPLAPLHLPAALTGVSFARQHFPTLPQVACLDTAFHAAMPAVAQTLPLAQHWRDAGIRRYGFHGLSCASIVHQLAPSLPARLVIAHLGNGASITAVREGRSIDNSMGFTPGGGVMMATRSGDLDPGVLIYLAREHGLAANQLEAVTDHQAGLLGVSALSGDMRVLRAALPDHAGARLATQMFTYSVSRHIAAMATALEGLDMLVFTGGIGEHDASSREEICARLAWMGVRLNPACNRSGDRRIGAHDAACDVCVFPSQEDEQMARHARQLLERSTQPMPG